MTHAIDQESGPAVQVNLNEVAKELGIELSSSARPAPRRRIGVAVVADGSGGTWALSPWDASVSVDGQPQLVESTHFDDEEAIRQAAGLLLRATAGPGVGTVNLMVDPVDGSFTFAGFTPDSQLDHAVVEQTASVDLADLAEQVKSGARLSGPAPQSLGHAIEARLYAQDPQNGFAPTPGRVLFRSVPSGVGIRVIAEETGPALLRVVAEARTRPEAIDRLRLALERTTVVVAGGTSNRSFLLRVLADEQFRAEPADTQWLDGFLARGGHVTAPDPVAVLVAAVEAADAEHAAERAAFHARAERGRPESSARDGVTAALRYAGSHYRLAVYQTGPDTYRVATDTKVVEMRVERLNAFERWVDCGGKRRRVVVTTHGATVRIEIDGAAHHVERDDGAVVRAGWPAFVVSIRVKVGDRVAAGDPIAVLEAMKMESTVTSPYSGVVASLEVHANSQVDAGATLLRIRPDDFDEPETEGGGSAAQLDFSGLGLAPDTAAPPCERVYGALRSYLLGYELDPATVKSLVAEQRQFAARAAATDPNLLHCEDAFLDLFIEIGLLSQSRQATGPSPEPGGQITPTPGTPAATMGTQEYLMSFLQWLDPDRAGLPEVYRKRLARALARYGVEGLTRSPELEDAVVWLFRSLSRLNELAVVTTRILQRRLTFRDALVPTTDNQLRSRFDRLTTAMQGRNESIADLSRDVRFRFVDEPLLEAGQAEVTAEMEGVLDLLAADPQRPDRAELIERLVECPQPMRQILLGRRLAGVDPAMQEVLLEVRARRWYRTRDLRNMSACRHQDRPLFSADYDYLDRRIHLVLAYVPASEIASIGPVVAEHLAGVDPTRAPIIDLMTWRDEKSPNGDDLAEQLATTLATWDVGRPIWRVDITTSSLSAEPTDPNRTQYHTFRGVRDGGLAEDRFYRNLHPMLAKRLDLWRLGNFDLERLPSQEDVYLFHGVARDNPKDHRLFAFAEVRDMTPVLPGRFDAPSYPRLERMGLQALIAMRAARAGFPARERPQANRITLFVRPPWDVPPEHWGDLANLLVPLAGGAGLDMLMLRANLRQPDGSLRPTVLIVEGLYGQGVTIREEPPTDEPVRPLTPYRQKVLTAQRFGVPYPWEILRMFAPEPGTVGKFLPATFVEHDLDRPSISELVLQATPDLLVPVTREPGRNTANVIVGLLTTYTEKVPEGMTRVAILSDPTRGLGNLAEPECRRINAALDLAERLQVPVEWFAVSSGALISMESGTENMDWISATLRRIIEFTQGGGEINIIVTGINVGGQPYWNAEATMLMHTRGILIMTPSSAMVLTGKQALDFSGGVSAEDNFGIGGYDRIMGPNGQGQYWAPTLEAACELLLRHYEYTYVVPGERYPRRAVSTDPHDRDVRSSPHAALPDSDFTLVGDVFSDTHNPDRKKPFDIRSVMRAVADADAEPLERWSRWRGGENSVVWDAQVGGLPVCMLGLESRPLARRGFVPADGPPQWTSGTLFPQASRKTARAINSASGNRPLVVLANLSGFDGSPESMRHWQLEYGAEIGRAVTNFSGPIVFVVVSRYHGGAFVVFSKALNPKLEIAAVRGSFASVIGGAPAAATVFAREVRTRVDKDPRVLALRKELAAATGAAADDVRARLAEVTEVVRSEKLGAAADEFDSIHTIDRALAMGSVDEIIAARDIRPYIIDALQRGMADDPGR